MNKLRWVLLLAVLCGSPGLAFAQALSGLPNPGLTASYIQVPNATSTGTTLFTLTKLTGAPSTAVIAATTDTAGILGIATNGVGTSGSVIIQESGLSYCVFDGATTAGDYVGISSTTGGDCHDVGFGPPSDAPGGGQIVGQVLSTNGSAGTYVMRLRPHILRTTIYEGNGGAGQTTATTAYFSPFGQSTNSTTESGTTQAMTPVAGTVENLQCRTSAAQGAGNSDAFTITSGTFGATGLSASSVTCTATNATSCSDATHTLSVTAGQGVEIKDVTTGNPSARTIACSFDLVF